jgi:alkaline phosphatase
MKTRRFLFLTLAALTFLASCSEQKPKNVIYLIGDGMGFGAVASLLLTEDAKTGFEMAPVIGLNETCSANNYVTDWCINSYESNQYAAFYLTQDKTLSNVTGRLDYNNMSLKGADGKILNIEYNPKVSSFKTTLQEQKIDTIGGKYPIFQRNGNLAYKEF